MLLNKRLYRYACALGKELDVLSALLSTSNSTTNSTTTTSNSTTDDDDRYHQHNHVHEEEEEVLCDLNSVHSASKTTPLVVACENKARTHHQPL